MRWKLAKLLLDMGPLRLMSPVLNAISLGLPLWAAAPVDAPCARPYGNPSNTGIRERVMMSAAERGRVNGIAEWGKVFGLMGVTNLRRNNQIRLIKWIKIIHNGLDFDR